MAIKARKLLLSFTLALMLVAALAVPAFAAGGVSQTSNISQSNFNNQIGGDCLKANCSQVNVQSNSASVRQTATVTNRSHAHKCWYWTPRWGWVWTWC